MMILWLLGGGVGKRTPQKLAMTATAALSVILDGDTGVTLVAGTSLCYI